jgi:hypothetical protein
MIPPEEKDQLAALRFLAGAAGAAAFAPLPLTAGEGRRSAVDVRRLVASQASKSRESYTTRPLKSLINGGPAPVTRFLSNVDLVLPQ